MGHAFIEYCARRLDKKLVRADFGDYFETDDAIYVKTNTLMNVSARCLDALENKFYFADLPNQLIVVCDDLDTKPGDVKTRSAGSAR